MKSPNRQEPGWRERNIYWVRWLRWLTVGLYLAYLFYVFVRPTTTEYLKVNGVSFFNDAATKGVGVLPDIFKASMIHIADLDPNYFFAFVLVSLGFALVYWMFNPSKRDKDGKLIELGIDDLVKGGLDGYYRLAATSLLATLVIIGSRLSNTTGFYEIYDSGAVVLLAGSVALLFLAWKRWKPDFVPRSDEEAAKKERVE